MLKCTKYVLKKLCQKIYQRKQLPIIERQVECLEYKQLYEEKQLKEKVLSLLIDVSNTIISSNIDINNIDKIIQTMLTITNSDEAYYSELANDKFIRKIGYTKNNTGYFSSPYEHNNLPEFYDTILNYQCYIINNNEFEPEEKIIFNNSNINSICCCPVVINSKLVGMLGFQTNRNIIWNNDTINLCQIMASLVSTYIAKQKLIEDLKHSKQKVDNICNTIELTIDLIDGYMWHKDSEGRYIYCTPNWKTTFFGLDSQVDIVGKNDIELLNEFRQRTSKEHTYGNICTGTDEHCKQQKNTCYYIEIGYIDNNIFILEVTKTPYFDEYGNYTGIVGIAKDRSNDKYLIEVLLEQYISQNLCENLNIQNMDKERVTAYWIKNKEINNQLTQKTIFPK